jgi:hypothetical protein
MAFLIRRISSGCSRIRKVAVTHLLLLAVCLLCSLSVPPDARADIPQAGEYQVKAAFILNFANYVEWPGGSLSRDTITIGILGQDPFGGALDSLRGKTVRGRRVVIRRYDEPEEAVSANILFISASERGVLQHVLKVVRGRSILTIGDSRGFADTGVMINMVVLQKRVGFEVNLLAARRAGLLVSSQLLKLAREVIEQ